MCWSRWGSRSPKITSPTRAVLGSVGRGRIDLHLITFDATGTGWQRDAAPGGGDCSYPAGGFGHRRLIETVVPCFTAELQLHHHLGYEPRERDRADVVALSLAFGLALPY